MLRAIYDVFHSLTREELPGFPVTLAYDMLVDERWDELDARWGDLNTPWEATSRDKIEAANALKFSHKTVVFHRPRGPASKAFLVPAAERLDFESPEEWRDYVEKHLASDENVDSLKDYVAGDRLKGDGNLRNWLPTRILAYTTGESEPWDALTYPTFPRDELVDDPQEFQ